jgi:hypothetical protein
MGVGANVFERRFDSACCTVEGSHTAIQQPFIGNGFLNLKSSYWQVDLNPGKDKTVFSTCEGLWQFSVMTFGVCNIPPVFERLLETVLRGSTSHVSCTWTM